MAKLGELYKITSGGTPSRTHSEYYEDGTIPWVKTGDLKDKYLFETDEKISQLGLENSSARIYLKNTVLLAMYGATIGATSILKIDAATNQACAAFSPREDTLPEYLYAFLESQKDKFIKDAVGGAQPNLSAGYLKTIEFKLPSLEQQTRITRNLSKIDELLLLRKQQIAKLDELVKARFVEMFGESEYPCNSLISLIIEGAGLSYGIVQPGDDGTGDMGVLRPVDFADGKIKTDSIKYIDRSLGDGFKKTELNGNELLITVRGTTGITALTDSRFKGMNVTRGIAVIRYDKKKVDPIYLNEYIKMEKSQQYIKEHTRGATLQQINLSELRDLEVVIPPLPLQRVFAAFVERVDQQKQTVQQSLEKLELMKKALMQEYFG